MQSCVEYLFSFLQSLQLAFLQLVRLFLQLKDWCLLFLLELGRYVLQWFFFRSYFGVVLVYIGNVSMYLQVSMLVFANLFMKVVLFDFAFYSHINQFHVIFFSFLDSFLEFDRKVVHQIFCINHSFSCVKTWLRNRLLQRGFFKCKLSGTILDMNVSAIRLALFRNCYDSNTICQYRC